MKKPNYKIEDKVCFLFNNSDHYEKGVIEGIISNEVRNKQNRVVKKEYLYDVKSNEKLVRLTENDLIKYNIIYFYNFNTLTTEKILIHTMECFEDDVRLKNVKYLLSNLNIEFEDDMFWHVYYVKNQKED